MDDTRLDGAVHGRSISDRRRLRGSGITRFLSYFQLFVERLELGFDPFIAGSQANGFTRSFDGRFRVGHGR